MSDPATEDWQARADELHDEMGVPKVRSRVVALREAGLSHREVSERLGLGGKDRSARHCRLYRDQRAASERLLADGPEI